MKNRVVVVPEDGMINVDNVVLHFAFDAPDNVHAIQWYGQSGHMEFTDDYNHELHGQEMYDAEILPYVQLWEAEKARLEAEANKPLSQEEQNVLIVQNMTVAIQKYLDDFAKTRMYDDISSACTYATSKNAVFKVEGQYAVDARDAVWAKAYEIQNAVLAGQRANPTQEELFAELPKLEWPTERPETI